MKRAFLCVVVWLSTASWALAADLASVERRIAKEPAYAGKPRYCLLVFGPDAKTRIWLALDGDKLYVDRNANGDLTDDGPPAVAKLDGEGETASRQFNVPELRDGPRTHKNLELHVYSLKYFAAINESYREYAAKNPDGRLYTISVDADVPGKPDGGRIGFHVSIRDANGYLRWTTSPADAPMIQFGGPLVVTLYSKDDFTIGRETDLVLGVGTLGVGPGTTAFCAYDQFIPEKLNPVAEISYPPKKTGDAPVKERYDLKERC